MSRHASSKQEVSHHGQRRDSTAGGNGIQT